MLGEHAVPADNGARERMIIASEALGRRPHRTYIGDVVVPTILDDILGYPSLGEALGARKGRITREMIGRLVKETKVTPPARKPGEKATLGEIGVAQVLFWWSFPTASAQAGQVFTELVQTELERRSHARASTSEEQKGACRVCRARGRANCPAHMTAIRFRPDSLGGGWSEQTE